jgi:hypothetical protein
VLSLSGRVKLCAIGAPHRDKPPALWARAVRELLAETPNNTSWQLLETAGKSIPDARTELVQHCLDRGVDRLLFLDDDVLPPPFALRLFMEHWKRPIVSGIYWSKDATASQPIVFTEYGAGPCLSWKPGSVFPIIGAGLGCCWLDVAMFRDLERPWFAADYSFRDAAGKVHQVAAAKGSNEARGDDFYFYARAQERGYQALCDSRILCTHIDWKTGTTYPEAATLRAAQPQTGGSMLFRHRASRDRLIHLQQLRDLAQTADNGFRRAVAGTITELGRDPEKTILCLACGDTRPQDKHRCGHCGQP